MPGTICRGGIWYAVSGSGAWDYMQGGYLICSIGVWCLGLAIKGLCIGYINPVYLVPGTSCMYTVYESCINLLVILRS